MLKAVLNLRSRKKTAKFLLFKQEANTLQKLSGKLAVSVLFMNKLSTSNGHLNSMKTFHDSLDKQLQLN